MSIEAASFLPAGMCCAFLRPYFTGQNDDVGGLTKDFVSVATMYPSRFQAAGRQRYSGKHIAVPVNFVCVAPGARHVALVGEFNGWDPAANPLKRQPDGAWTTQVVLSHGHHQYMFCVDGHLVLDPRAQGISRNKDNHRVSMIAVS